MSVEKDAGRDLKKVGLLAGLIFIALAVIYLMISWLNRPAPATSHIDLDKAATGGTRNTEESAEYRALLDKYNQENASNAAANGGTYIASVHTDTIPVTTPAEATARPQPAVGKPSKATVVVRSGLDPDRKKAVDNLLKELAVQWSPAQGQLAGSPDTGTNAPNASPQNGQPGGTFRDWTNSLSVSRSPTEQNAVTMQTSVPAVELIPAGQRTAGVIDNLVNSDNSRSQVTAHVPAGKYAGAVFLSQDVQLAGDGVSIHFTEMDWHEKSYNVDVWAEQQDTLAGTVASEVDHHYLSRIFIPAIAHGIGSVGRLYENANTRILSTQYGEITADVGDPDGKAVSGSIIGGAADKAGEVIERDMASLPATQVLVYRNEPVSLLFMKAVSNNDAIEKGRHAPDQIPQPVVTRPVLTQAATPTSPIRTGDTYQRAFPRRSDND